MNLQRVATLHMREVQIGQAPLSHLARSRSLPLKVPPSQLAPGHFAVVQRVAQFGVDQFEVLHAAPTRLSVQGRGSTGSVCPASRHQVVHGRAVRAKVLRHLCSGRCANALDPASMLQRPSATLARFMAISVARSACNIKFDPEKLPSNAILKGKNHGI